MDRSIVAVHELFSGEQIAVKHFVASTPTMGEEPRIRDKAVRDDVFQSRLRQILRKTSDRRGRDAVRAGMLGFMVCKKPFDKTALEDHS